MTDSAGKIDNPPEKLEMSSSSGEGYGTFDAQDDKDTKALLTLSALRSRRHGFSLLRALLVEFIGDLIFIFIGAMSGTSKTNLVGGALAHGVTIFVLIASMGHISGGHFNPAVTLGVLTSGAIPIINAVFYILAQLLGGFVGALFLRAVLHDQQYELIKGGVTVPPTGTYPMEGITCEIIFTYLLVMTVLLTAVDTSSNLLAPLAIGLSITVDILAGGNVSGASMNPARSLGPAIGYSIFGTGNEHWNLHYIYWVGPIIGAIIAGVVYRAFFAHEEKRWLLKKSN